jgi:hypothetical protein
VCRGSSFASLVLAPLCWAVPAAAQSVHLTQLEIATPALSADGLGSASWGGWPSAWVAPAAAGRALGIVASYQREDFSSTTTSFIAARFAAGPVWQLHFAQARLSDVFDPALLETYPGLSALGMSATTLGIDAILPWTALALSAGGRLERDELLGERTVMVVGRVSGRVVLLGLNLFAAAERGVPSGTTGAALGRLTAGLGHHVQWSFVRFDLGAAARLGDVWKTSRAHATMSAALRAEFARVAALYGGLGIERNQFGSGWLSFASVGVAVSVGHVAAHVRRGGQTAATAAPIAVSLLYDPSDD